MVRVKANDSMSTRGYPCAEEDLGVQALVEAEKLEFAAVLRSRFLDHNAPASHALVFCLLYGGIHAIGVEGEEYVIELRACKITTAVVCNLL